MQWKSHAGLQCAVDMCLMASSEDVIIEKVNECVIEYSLKVNEKESKVVCINGEIGRR